MVFRLGAAGRPRRPPSRMASRIAVTARVTPIRELAPAVAAAVAAAVVAATPNDSQTFYNQCAHFRQPGDPSVQEPRRISMHAGRGRRPTASIGGRRCGRRRRAGGRANRSRRRIPSPRGTWGVDGANLVIESSGSARTHRPRAGSRASCPGRWTPSSPSTAAAALRHRTPPRLADPSRLRHTSPWRAASPRVRGGQRSPAVDPVLIARPRGRLAVKKLETAPGDRAARELRIALLAPVIRASRSSSPHGAQGGRGAACGPARFVEATHDNGSRRAFAEMNGGDGCGGGWHRRRDDALRPSTAAPISDGAGRAGFPRSASRPSRSSSFGGSCVRRQLIAGRVPPARACHTRPARQGGASAELPVDRQTKFRLVHSTRGPRRRLVLPSRGPCCAPLTRSLP